MRRRRRREELYSKAKNNDDIEYTVRANTVDKMFYEFHKESLVGNGGSSKRLRDPQHVIKNTGKFMER